MMYAWQIKSMTTYYVPHMNKYITILLIEKEGDPSREDPVLPVLIPVPNKDGEMQKIAAVAAGGTCGGHTVCVTSSGEVWAWGKNNFGQTARVAIAHRKNLDRMIPQKSMSFVGVCCRCFNLLL